MSASFKPVSTNGERYEAIVPDTLDLAERAGLAINGLGGTLDPKSDYDVYFAVTYRAQPPYMCHLAFDPTNTAKFAESFPFMRVMSGSNQHVDTENALMSSLVGRLSPDDGLYYNICKPERPWHAAGHVGYGNVREDYANVAGVGRMLRAMIAWRERDGDPAWDDRIRAMVRGLERIAVHSEGYAYFPDGGFAEAFSYPRSGWLHTDEPSDKAEGEENLVVAYHGHQLLGLAWWYQLSGDERVLDFARKLANFIMLPRFWGADDVYTLPMAQERGHYNLHLHARMIGLRGLLQLAIATDDQRMKDFVRSSYEFTRTQGIPRIGWFTCAEWAEGCTLGDMIATAIKLSDAGVGDYWDDVDCIARNLLIEQQLVRPELLERLSESGPPRHLDPRRPDGKIPSAAMYPGQCASDRVIERSLGVFAGASTPTNLRDAAVSQCCTGNATQGLYYAWEGIVRYRDGAAQVNLLLNRASQWLDIDSYLPYEGRVVIRNKKATRVSVRIPSWVNRREIQCRVREQERRLEWIGNYISIDGLAPGDAVTLEFPIVEDTISTTAALDPTWRKVQTYKCSFKGNTLIDIYPRDESRVSYPIFQRDHYRHRTTPMKTATRYVYPGVLEW